MRQMPKIRIHELAKELNVDNKAVMDYLKENKVEVKSHMSTLEENQEAMVRKAFSPQNSAKEEKQEASPKKPEGHKKKNIIQVFRPQNATTREAKNSRRFQERPAGNRPHPERRSGEKPQVQAAEKAEPRAAVKPQQPETPQAQPEAREVRAQAAAPQGTQGDRPQRSFGDRNQGGRQGDRPQRSFGDRNQGGRPGDRPQRSFGDRNQGGRPGDRPQRSFGDRPQGQGGRPGFQGRPERRDDGSGRRGFDSRSRGPRTDRDRKPQEVMDVGLKKPSRDASYKDRDKDKNKDSLRENKFASDRRSGSGNRPNQGRRQQHTLPKALQKPVHRPKEEKHEEIKEITLPEKLTIRELADKMKMQPSVIVKKLFLEGVMVTVNQEIDFEKAQEIALGYDIIAEPEEKVDVIEELLKEADEDESKLQARPPVVCVMGHVDHGKTSLLDAIRHAHVTDREAGGITQHIGAYVVTINGQKITFLDTPGHEAFTAMRMRGANSTDIAVLVVAADDGVMPQTIEAINHAKAAEVEIIVAVNKIDKPGANVDRVKQELSEYGLIPEDWGGSTIFVPVSAKTQEGLDNLLEMILLTAEVMELKANPDRLARGLVLEAKLDKGKGPVANILVQKGTLHVGDYIAAGSCSGKVRAMMDENSRRLKEAGPSTPVEVLGLNDVPNAGEILVATETDKEAKNFAATFVSEGKNRLLEDTKAKMSLDDLFSQIQEGSLKELNLVVKADVQGSVEAVKQSLLKLSNEEVVVKIVHGGVGAINESDVTLAAASNAIIIGFNVRPDATAKTIAEQEGVDVRLYRVIYQAIEDIEAAMKGMLDPVYEEKVIGHAEIRQLFKASGVGTIAGSYILDGSFQRDCKVRISREGKQIFEGALASLKRFKDDVKEVKAGYECGLVFEGFNEIQELDQVEAYIMVEVPR